MNITVIGAYGYTGKLICHELENHQLKFSIAGRDAAKLESLKTILKSNPISIPGDISISEIAGKIISESDLIINCAGPFTEESKLLLSLVATRGKVYLDITGEIGFVKNSRESFHEVAQKSKSLIIHGCAFESLLADLACQIAARHSDIKEVLTFYWFSNKLASPGSKITMKLSKFRKPLTIQKNAWSQTDSFNYKILREADQRNYSAVSYPLPEIAFSFWKHNVARAGTYLLLEPEEAKFVNRTNQVEGDPQEELNRLRQKKQNGPIAAERANQLSEIRIALKLKNGDDPFLLIENSDMYQTTAVAIRLAVEKIIAGVQLSGVINPAALFKGEEENTLKMLNAKMTEIKSSALYRC